MRLLAIAILTITLAACGDIDAFDPNEITYTGKDARPHLSLCDRDQLPASISDLWVFENGTFGGMIYYVSFRCETVEDCWRAVRAFGAPEKSEFAKGIQSNFAVNRHGPSFYFRDFQHPQWDISKIRKSVFYEWNRDDRVMDFWAIDLQRLRVYFHHESGGFPDDPPSVRHRM